MRDTSLDDFVGEGDADAAEDGTAEPVADDEPVDVGTDASADTDAEGETTTPASPTFDWTPGGAACAACGERVERRWTDGDRLVCAACKEW